FYFRYACKLLERRKFDEAAQIFDFLITADWLEPEFKLTVISQSCHLAQARGRDEEFKQRSSLALSVIEQLIQEATSVEARRHLLVTKGQHLEQSGHHDQALE